MNKKRREIIERIHAELDELAAEEQEALNNMPESIQDSERGELMQGFIENIEAARDELGNIINQ